MKASKGHSSGCVVVIVPLRLVVVLQEPGWVFRQAEVPHWAGAVTERCPVCHLHWGRAALPVLSQQIYSFPDHH